jgi:hypothetical protein
VEVESVGEARGLSMIGWGGRRRRDGGEERGGSGLVSGTEELD